MHSKYLSLLNFRLEIFENQSATVLMGYRASKKKKKNAENLEEKLQMANI